MLADCLSMRPPIDTQTTELFNGCDRNDGFRADKSSNRMTTMGRYEPLNQVDRSTADLKTAVAESFDGSSLRVSRRSPWQPAASSRPVAVAGARLQEWSRRAGSPSSARRASGFARRHRPQADMPAKCDRHRFIEALNSTGADLQRNIEDHFGRWHSIPT